MKRDNFGYGCYSFNDDQAAIYSAVGDAVVQTVLSTPNRVINPKEDA